MSYYCSCVCLHFFFIYVLYLFSFRQIIGPGPGVNTTPGVKSSNPKSSRKSTPPALEMAIFLNNGMYVYAVCVIHLRLRSRADVYMLLLISDEKIFRLPACLPACLPAYLPLPYSIYSLIRVSFLPAYCRALATGDSSTPDLDRSRPLDYLIQPLANSLTLRLHGFDSLSGKQFDLY